jgi:hypothetical protein
MTIDETRYSPVACARIAGIGYLIIIAAGLFAEGLVRSRLIASGDASATAANIMASEGLFRTGIAADLLMLTFDAVVAIALYLLLRPVSRFVSLLSTSFRLVHTAVYGITVLSLLIVLDLLGGAGHLASLGGQGAEGLAMVFLNAHGMGYRIGLVFFGVHCMFLGCLIWRSGYLPRFLSILMILAALGYLIDSFAGILMTDYAEYASAFLLIVAVPAVVGELAVALWLLIKEVDAEKWQACARQEV